MYYEETILNGVLCFRTTPSTPFVECSKEKLTAKIQELEGKLGMKSARNKIDPDKTLYNELQKGWLKSRYGKTI